MTDFKAPADINSQRQAIRQQVRKLRNALSREQQQQAAQMLVGQMLQLPQVIDATHIALYLSNDAELDTSPLIQALWQAGKNIYLPILHPFVPGYLIFQRYQQDTAMKLNRFQIPEPVLNCADIIPVAELDVICTPLVAFDAQGNRLGMGGGFYDRYLAHCHASSHIVGLAHAIQRLTPWRACPWDINLDAVITEAAVHRFSPRRNQYQHHRKRHTFD